MRRSLGSISTSTSSASGGDQHAGRRGVDTALGLGGGHPLHAVHAALVLQPRPDALAGLVAVPPLAFTATWTSL